MGRIGHRDAERVLDGERMGQGVRGGSVAADALGEVVGSRGVEPFEQLLDATVREPEPDLELEHALAFTFHFFNRDGAGIVNQPAHDLNQELSQEVPSP